MASYLDSVTGLLLILRLVYLKGFFAQHLNYICEVNQPSYQSRLDISISRLKTKLVFLHVNINTNWKERIDILIQTHSHYPLLNMLWALQETLYFPLKICNHIC